MGTQVENSIKEDSGTVELLATSAEDYCRRALSVERLRALRGNTPAFDMKVWRELCDLGWPRIATPEELGGLELGAAAVGTLCRQLGRVAAPEPLLESGVLIANLLGSLATKKAGDQLEKILEAQSLIGTSLMESDENLEATSARVSVKIRNDGYLLDGVSRGLPLAPDMEAFVICAYCDENPMLFFVPANHKGVHLEAHELADGTTNGHIEFRSVLLADHALLAEGFSVSNALDYTRELARLGSSAYLLGIAETLFDMTLEYLCTREQFGRPIGGFQALQHRAVDLFIQKELTASVVEECLTEFDNATDHGSRRRAASRAKYRAGETALLVARQAVQLHGGIGFTDECNVGLYLNRALVISARYGNSSFHCRRLSHLIAPENENNETTLISKGKDLTNKDWNKLADDQFRSAVRAWLERDYPEEMRYPSRRPRWHEIKPWYLKLAAKGWVAPAWPVEFGGMGLSPAKLLIFIEEQERWGVARAPDMGIQMVGPLLIKHGTPEQQKRYLPPILNGDEVWCQGYSEPNAGSDLASLKTEAILDGDDFVINGQKTWTTLAQDATHMFCLARTSNEGKPQEGISFFLIDLDQPGVTIRPIRNLAGHEEFCEVFLDEVRVPADCLVGEINQGWTLAKALLGFERIFLGSPKQSQYALKRLEELALACGLYKDAAFADRITRLKLDVLDLETTYKRFADIVRRGKTLGPDVSLLKIWATETFARLSELMLEVSGSEGSNVGKVDFNGTHIDILSQFYNARPATIYAGSNEIQRNIIAKHVLRLPTT